MLILPLHKKPSAENFPWVTLALILANIFVFAFLQSDDAAVTLRAASYFRDSGLAAIEIPRYAAYLREQDRQGKDREALLNFLSKAPEPQRSAVAVQMIESDSEFLAELSEKPPFDDYRIATWRQQRARLDQLWSQRFTERWMMHFGRFEPLHVFSAMFLHAGVGHLLGNMVFLAFLGLLVEGALGPALFLAVYLLGGFGGGALSLLRHLGDSGGGLGASGAIAGLMGAYCVIWGLRKVRFFWWFFVVFDYVKAPALLLLPFWLGWELFSLWRSPDAHIAFDVHAGGIACGALLAFGVRRMGWERRAFLDEEEQRDERAALLENGLQALGRLDFPKARAALTQLAQLQPQDLAVLVPLFRSWRDRPNDDGFHDAARRVLLHASGRREDIVEAQKIFADYLQATQNKPRLSAGEILQLSRRWQTVGAYAEAERMLGLLLARQPALQGLPDAYLALALGYRDRGDRAAAERLLRQLVERFPITPPGEKAAFLLAHA